MCRGCKETPMMDKVQMEMAKTLWEQSAPCAAGPGRLGHGAEVPADAAELDAAGRGAFGLAADQFAEKLVQFQAEQQQAAVAFVEDVADYAKLLEQQKC
jgi:hypothetical protein